MKSNRRIDCHQGWYHEYRPFWIKTFRENAVGTISCVVRLSIHLMGTYLYAKQSEMKAAYLLCLWVFTLCFWGFGVTKLLENGDFKCDRATSLVRL